jgi:precorrin-6B methylase 2
MGVDEMISKIIRYLNVIRTKFGVPTVVENNGLFFYCPTFTEMWRVETLYTKEPETIAWIDRFLPHSMLWDFGANVGTYTIYAAKKGHSVVAIEPSSREWELLKRNIELNLVWVVAKNIFADTDTDYSSFPKPDYIKIDTDGNDIKILKGLDRGGALSKAKEILIEVEPESEVEITDILNRNGFILKTKEHSSMMVGTPYEKYYNAIFVRGW